MGEVGSHMASIIHRDGLWTYLCREIAKTFPCLELTEQDRSFVMGCYRFLGFVQLGIQEHATPGAAFLQVQKTFHGAVRS